jgi:hypothetical protein
MSVVAGSRSVGGYVVVTQEEGAIWLVERLRQSRRACCDVVWW